MILTREDLAEVELTIQAAHFKDIVDSKLIQKWVQLNQPAIGDSVANINDGSLSIRWSPGEPKSAVNPNQKIRYVLKRSDKYPNAQKQAKLIRAMANAPNQEQYNQARQTLIGLGYSSEELNEIKPPDK